jgi:hypothetical protein
MSDTSVVHKSEENDLQRVQMISRITSLILVVIRASKSNSKDRSTNIRQGLCIDTVHYLVVHGNIIKLINSALLSIPLHLSRTSEAVNSLLELLEIITKPKLQSHINKLNETLATEKTPDEMNLLTNKSTNIDSSISALSHNNSFKFPHTDRSDVIMECPNEFSFGDAAHVATVVNRNLRRNNRRARGTVTIDTALNDRTLSQINEQEEEQDEEDEDDEDEDIHDEHDDDDDDDDHEHHHDDEDEEDEDEDEDIHNPDDDEDDNDEDGDDDHDEDEDESHEESEQSESSESASEEHDDEGDDDDDEEDDHNARIMNELHEYSLFHENETQITDDSYVNVESLFTRIPGVAESQEAAISRFEAAINNRFDTEDTSNLPTNSFVTPPMLVNHGTVPGSFIVSSDGGFAPSDRDFNMFIDLVRRNNPSSGLQDTTRIANVNSIIP